MTNHCICNIEANLMFVQLGENSLTNRRLFSLPLRTWHHTTKLSESGIIYSLILLNITHRFTDDLHDIVTMVFYS